MCFGPIVPFAASGSSVGFFGEYLDGNGRAHDDLTNFGRADAPVRVHLLQTNVGVCVLEVGGEVLVLEDSCEGATEVERSD